MKGVIGVLVAVEMVAVCCWYKRRRPEEPRVRALNLIDDRESEEGHDVKMLQSLRALRTSLGHTVGDSRDPKFTAPEHLSGHVEGKEWTLEENRLAQHRRCQEALISKRVINRTPKPGATT